MCFLVFFITNQYFTVEIVFKANNRLLFSLFIINQLCKTNVMPQKMYYKQEKVCFLVYSSLISIPSLMFYHKNVKGLIIIVQISKNFHERMLFCFFSKFYKTSTNGCLLVYSSTFINTLFK